VDSREATSSRMRSWVEKWVIDAPEATAGLSRDRIKMFQHTIDAQKTESAEPAGGDGTFVAYRDDGIQVSSSQS